MAEELIAKLGLDPSAFERGLELARDKAHEIVSDITREIMGVALAWASVEGAVESLQLAGKIEQQTLRIRELLGVSEEAGRGIRETFEELSFATGQTVDAIVEGQAEAIHRGYRSVAESTEIARVGAELATASFTQMGAVMPGLVEVMKEYDLSADHARTVSDLLVGAAHATGQEVAQLAPAVGSLAQQASKSGVSFQDMLSVVAGAAPYLHSAAQAGETLNVILFRVSAMTDEAKQKWRDYGIEIDAFLSHQIPLQKFLREIGTATGGDAAILKELFSGGGSRAPLGDLMNLQHLVDPKVLDEVDAVRTKTAAMADETERAFKTVEDSGEHVRKKFVEIGEQGLTAFGDPLLGRIKEAAGGMEQLRSIVTAVASGLGDLIGFVASKPIQDFLTPWRMLNALGDSPVGRRFEPFNPAATWGDAGRYALTGGLIDPRLLPFSGIEEIPGAGEAPTAVSVAATAATASAINAATQYALRLRELAGEDVRAEKAAADYKDAVDKLADAHAKGLLSTRDYTLAMAAARAEEEHYAETGKSVAASVKERAEDMARLDQRLMEQSDRAAEASKAWKDYLRSLEEKSAEPFLRIQMEAEDAEKRLRALGAAGGATAEEIAQGLHYARDAMADAQLKESFEEAGRALEGAVSPEKIKDSFQAIRDQFAGLAIAEGLTTQEITAGLDAISAKEAETLQRRYDRRAPDRRLLFGERLQDEIAGLNDQLSAPGLYLKFSDGFASAVSTGLVEGIKKGRVDAAKLMEDLGLSMLKSVSEDTIKLIARQALTGLGGGQDGQGGALGSAGGVGSLLSGAKQRVGDAWSGVQDLVGGVASFDLSKIFGGVGHLSDAVTGKSQDPVQQIALNTLNTVKELQKLTGGAGAPGRSSGGAASAEETVPGGGGGGGGGGAPAGGGVFTFIADALNGIGTGVSTAYNAVADAVTSAVSGAESAVESGLHSVGDLFGKIGGGISDLITGGGGAGALGPQSSSKIVDGLTQTAQNTHDTVLGVHALPGAIGDSLANVFLPGGKQNNNFFPVEGVLSAAHDVSGNLFDGGGGSWGAPRRGGAQIIVPSHGPIFTRGGDGAGYGAPAAGPTFHVTVNIPSMATVTDTASVRRVLEDHLLPEMTRIAGRTLSGR